MISAGLRKLLALLLPGPRVPRDERLARFRFVHRETLRYSSGGRELNIGAFGPWRRGSEVEFLVNDRWNPPRTGPELSPAERDEVTELLVLYAAAEGLVPRIKRYVEGGEPQSVLLPPA